MPWGWAVCWRGAPHESFVVPGLPWQGLRRTLVIWLSLGGIKASQHVQLHGTGLNLLVSSLKVTYSKNHNFMRTVGFIAVLCAVPRFNGWVCWWFGIHFLPVYWSPKKSFTWFLREFGLCYITLSLSLSISLHQGLILRIPNRWLRMIVWPRHGRKRFRSETPGRVDYSL